MAGPPGRALRVSGQALLWQQGVSDTPGGGMPAKDNSVVCQDLGRSGCRLTGILKVENPSGSHALSRVCGFSRGHYCWEQP